MAAGQGDEWGLTWLFRWGIYSSIPVWTHSQNSLAAAEALNLKISSHGRSLKWSFKDLSKDLSNDTLTFVAFEVLCLTVNVLFVHWLYSEDNVGNFDNGTPILATSVLGVQIKESQPTKNIKPDSNYIVLSLANVENIYRAMASGATLCSKIVFLD